jgi:IS1 family transposase
VGRVFLFWGL